VFLFKRILCFLAFGSAIACSATDYSGKDTRGIEDIVRKVETIPEQWRREAHERIEQHRKSPVTLFIVDKKTKQPLQNVMIQFKQIQHSYDFGTVVAKGFQKPDPAKAARSKRRKKNCD